jgi:hypothetical protein
VVIATGEVAGGGHAEGGGEAGSGVAGAVGVVFGFGSEKKAVEAFVGAYGVEGIGATGEHFMDVTLVGDVEDEFIVRGGEDFVEGDGEFDDAEVGAEVSAVDGEGFDEGVAYSVGEFEKLLLGEFLEVVRRLDAREDGHGGGRVCLFRRGRCHYFRESL